MALSLNKRLNYNASYQTYERAVFHQGAVGGVSVVGGVRFSQALRVRFPAAVFGTGSPTRDVLGLSNALNTK